MGNVFRAWYADQFCNYGLHVRLPGHSNLSRVRQRWAIQTAAMNRACAADPRL
jgi:hypothetical protein